MQVTSCGLRICETKVVGCSVKLKKEHWEWNIKRILESYSGRISRYALPIIIFLHLFITILLSNILNIWIDEAFSLNTTNSNLMTALQRALFFELQPPFYFLILNLWRSLNQSIFFARFLSILFTCATVYATWRLSKQFFKKVHPAWATSLVAFNPFVIWAATEIRCYALVLLLSALLLLFFFDGYISKESHNHKRLIYLGFSIISLYTHYYLGFLLVANAIVLLFFKKWSTLRSYLYGMSIVAFSFIPMLFVLPHQMNLHIYTGEPASFIGVLRVVNGFIRRHLLGEWNLAVSLINRIIYYTSTVLMAILLVKKYKKYLVGPARALFVIFWVMVIFFLALVKFISVKSIFYNHSAVLFIPAILFALSILFLIENKIVRTICILVIVIFYGYGLKETFSQGAKNGDWKRVASYIENNEGRGEPILFFTNWGAIPFAHYYRGVNEKIPLPKKFDMDHYEFESPTLKEEKEIVECLRGNPEKIENMWIITQDVGQFLGFKYKLEILEDFIKKYCIVKGEKKFYRSRVRNVKLEYKFDDRN